MTSENYVIIALNPDGTVDVLEWFIDLDLAKAAIKRCKENEWKSWVDDGGEHLLLERLVTIKKENSGELTKEWNEYTKRLEFDIGKCIHKLAKDGNLIAKEILERGKKVVKDNNE